MICKVRKAVEKYGMPLNGAHITVGLSGGADSMALLHVMNSLKSEYGFTLSACHVNHGIRGENADRDESFVREQCENLGVGLHVLHADVPALAEKRGIGLEECGRQVRYEFFASLGGLTATAHTLSDRTETLLLNITRGSSVRGLRSIPAVRGSIIRPLIECTRDEIEAYCAENEIPYITDETNFDDSYSRNRIRLRVIPELKKINPSLEAAAERLAEAAAEDEDFFTDYIDRLLKTSYTAQGYRVNVFADEHIAVRKRIIAEILHREANINPELIHVKMVDSILSGGRTEVLGNTVVQVKNGVLTVNPEADEYTPWECDFSGFTAEAPSGRVTARIINRNDLPPKQIVHNRVLDFDCIVGKCVLRNRRAGDKMRTAGSGCTKSLKKLFNEKHLDRRNSRMIIADDLGILWVEGIGCADRCKIKADTVNVLLIGEDV